MPLSLVAKRFGLEVAEPVILKGKTVLWRLEAGFAGFTVKVCKSAGNKEL